MLAWRDARAGVMTDYDHASIDEVLHSRVRLAIVAFLAGAKNAEFSVVRDAIRTTDGNASVHLRKLEDAGYIAVQKHFVARRPQTLYALTARGKEALLRYVAHLETLLAPGSGLGHPAAEDEPP
jgi:DNA-binding MarR family transcriptional regulator